MIIFAALLLTALTFAFVAYPLFRQRRHSAGPAVDEKLGEMLSKRDTTYSMLKELEFDLQSGILSQEDYQDLEARYRSKAISVLKGIDGLKEAGDVEADIERQVLELRRSGGSFCPQCGDKRQPNDRFCPRCDASLNKGEPVD